MSAGDDLSRACAGLDAVRDELAHLIALDAIPAPLRHGIAQAICDVAAAQAIAEALSEGVVVVPTWPPAEAVSA